MLRSFNRNQEEQKKHDPLRIQGSTLFFLDDVSVQYGDIKALKSVHLNVTKGEVLFITGASGAGKTTLLKVLAGDVEATSGRAIVPSNTNGSTVFVSQVFQNLRLLNQATCLDNLLMAYDPNLYRSKAEFLSDMNELAKVLGVYDRLSMTMKDANGGLRQKVAIIRSLLSRPDVFIGDEPTSSLDYESTRKIFDVLNLYNAKRGLTVIWASHNRELVKKFTGRIVHLDNGRLVYSGHACFI